MDETKVSELLPPNYLLTATYHFPNIEIVSTSTFCQKLPLRLWLLLNSMFGKIRKGYWILLKYIKG